MDKKYDALKQFQIFKFQDRFSNVINKLKENNVKVELPSISKFSIKIADEIYEDKMKNIILENTKSAYSPYTKTIYIHQSLIDTTKFEYHFTKRMLEHMSTKIVNGKVLNGVSITSDNIKYNHSLNQAITENLTNILLGNENMDEDVFKNYIIERHHLGLIQSVVGLDTIMNSFFNSDYMQLETKFEEYGVKYQPLAVQMDILTNINYNITYSPKPEENSIETNIFFQILEAYTKKASQSKVIENKDSFENHIINSQTVRGAFGTTEKFGYEGVDRNLQVFKTVIKGLEISNSLTKENDKRKRSIT